MSALKRSGRLPLNLAVITPAPPAATAALLSDLGVSIGPEHGIEAYSDESLLSYTEAGMRFVSTTSLIRGKPVAGPAAVMRYLGWSLFCRCRWPGLAAGDWRQVGGVLVAGPRGRYLTLVQEYPGIPALDDAALEAACARAARGEEPPADAGVAAAHAASREAGPMSASSGLLEAATQKGTVGGEPRHGHVHGASGEREREQADSTGAVGGAAGGAGGRRRRSRSVSVSGRK